MSKDSTLPWPRHCRASRSSQGDWSDQIQRTHPGRYAPAFFPPSPRINHGMQIRLTNSGIPVTVIDSDADEIFPTDLTVAPTHRYTEPLNAMGLITTEGESSEPLFRLKITRFTKLNSTTIGASNSHALCASSLDLPSSPNCVDGNEFS